MIHHRGNTNPHQYLEKGFSVTFLFYFLFLLLHEHPERHCLSVNKWFSTRIPFDYVYSPINSLMAQNHSFKKRRKLLKNINPFLFLVVSGSHLIPCCWHQPCWARSLPLKNMNLWKTPQTPSGGDRSLVNAPCPLLTC